MAISLPWSSVNTLPRFVAGLAKGGRARVEFAEKFPQVSWLSSEKLLTREEVGALYPHTADKAMVSGMEMEVTAKTMVQSTAQDNFYNLKSETILSL